LHLPPILATVIFLVGIAGLFWLDRDPEARVSKALWIPTAWMLITGSRPVSMWLGVSPTGSQGDVYLEGSPIDRFVLLALLVGGYVVLAGRAGHVEPVLKKNGLILLFFSYAALSVVWSDYPFVTFKHWIRGISDVAMVLVVLTETDVNDAINRLVTRVGFTLLPLSVLLCKYYPGLGRFVNRSWVMEWTGVATQKNGLGTLCWVFGLGLLWRFRSVYRDREDPSRRRRLVALGTVLGMVIWLLWVCNSLTSICAFAMAGAVMLLSGRPAFRHSPLLLHLLVVALIGASAFALFFQSSGALVGHLGRDASLSGRSTIWAAVLSVPVNRLFGAGYESFWLGHRLDEVQSVTGMDTSEAHNGYIEMYVNLGWIGVILLGALIFSGYRNVIGAYRRDPDAGSLRPALFLGTVVAGFTEAAFRVMGLTWIVFLLATANSQWGAAQETGGRGRPTEQLQLPPEEPRSVPEEAVIRGSTQDNSWSDYVS
jgi:exopolysaccharide production protein ExoQ